MCRKVPWTYLLVHRVGRCGPSGVRLLAVGALKTARGPRGIGALASWAKSWDISEDGNKATMCFGNLKDANRLKGETVNVEGNEGKEILEN